MDLTVWTRAGVVTLTRNDYGNFDAEASALALRADKWPGALEVSTDSTGRTWLLCANVGPVVTSYVSRDGLLRLLVWSD